jgi:hypothetical protein
MKERGSLPRDRRVGCERDADPSEGFCGEQRGCERERRSSSRRREPSVPGTLGVCQPIRRRRKETPVEQQ